MWVGLVEAKLISAITACVKKNQRGGTAAGEREGRSLGEKTRYACLPDFVILALAPAELSAGRYRQEPALWIDDQDMPFVNHQHGHFLELDAIMCRVLHPWSLSLTIWLRRAVVMLAFTGIAIGYSPRYVSTWPLRD